MVRPLPLPIGKKVTVSRDKVGAKTEGGIFLPEQSQKPLSQGDIWAVGPTCTLLSSNDVGRKVAFNKWGGVEVPVDDHDFVVLGEEELVCFLPNS